MEPFAVYQEMTRNATEKINAGTFDFDRDMAPNATKDFTEIVKGVPLSLTEARSSFPPILAAVAQGAVFSWTVALEAEQVLAPDTALLVTKATLAFTFPDGREEAARYRITSILTRADSARWLFLHQHRTELSD